MKLRFRVKFERGPLLFDFHLYPSEAEPAQYWWQDERALKEADKFFAKEFAKAHERLSTERS